MCGVIYKIAINPIRVEMTGFSYTILFYFPARELISSDVQRARPTKRIVLSRKILNRSGTLQEIIH